VTPALGVSFVALAGLVVAAALLVALHLLPTGADPVRHGVSEYGIGRYAALYRMQVVASGVGALTLVGALLGETAQAVPLAFLALYGVARVLIARFPTDLALPMTRSGRIHALLAAAAFLALAVAAPWLSASAVAAADWPEARDGVLGLAIGVTMASLGSFAVAALPWTVRVYGVAQRAFYVLGFAWLIAVAVAVLVAR
jgi:hypothetical protein